MARVFKNKTYFHFLLLMGKYDILRSVKWLDDEDQARKVPLQVFSLLLPSMMATAVSVENAPDVRCVCKKGGHQSSTCCALPHLLSFFLFF